MAHVIDTRHLTIDSDNCRLCRRCPVMKSCRCLAIVRFDGDEPPVIDVGRCCRCLVCIDQCPYEAVVWA